MTTSSWSTSTSTTACAGSSTSTGYALSGSQSYSGTAAIYGVHTANVTGSPALHGLGWPGVLGIAACSGAIGVRGLANFTNATAGDFECIGTPSGSCGVYATGGAYAGYFQGTLYASTLSKGSGTFQIDYPMHGMLGSPDTHFLFHGFVESDVARNTYSGNAMLDANGEFVVEMPEWFTAVCGESSVTVSGNGKRMMTGWERVGVTSFRLLGDANCMVSWTITAPRVDAVQRAANTGVVVAKEEPGMFLNPELYGHGKDKHVLRRIRESE